MSTTAAAAEVGADFDAYHDRALNEPVRVTKHGQETVYIVSARLFHDLRRNQRHTLDVSDLTDAEMEAIEAAEIPEEHRYAMGS